MVARLVDDANLRWALHSPLCPLPLTASRHPPAAAPVSVLCRLCPGVRRFSPDRHGSHLSRARSGVRVAAPAWRPAVGGAAASGGRGAKRRRAKEGAEGGGRNGSGVVSPTHAVPIATSAFTMGGRSRGRSGWATCGVWLMFEGRAARSAWSALLAWRAGGVGRPRRRGALIHRGGDRPQGGTGRGLEGRGRSTRAGPPAPSLRSWCLPPPRWGNGRRGGVAGGNTRPPRSTAGATAGDYRRG